MLFTSNVMPMPATAGLEECFPTLRCEDDMRVAHVWYNVSGMPEIGRVPYVATQQKLTDRSPRMLQTVIPVLPALIIAHAWMTMILVHTLSDESIHALPPEAYPV